ATTCPPPRHNFTELPRIRSERPAFELHYPHMVERMRAEAHVGLTGQPTSTLEKSDDRRQID
ncbi:cytochrome ubiquinol oxidase subunit I, partial [Rhodococcus qingshengii]|nr:cytochrome ubiquinol oxidase subunit I [Rhodococcus qingshengii]